MNRPRAIGMLLGLLGAFPACDDVRFRENPVQIDTFEQTPNPTVDILWVVDNSGTMRDERDKLGEKFDQFMSRLQLSEADYHIGIVSTDTADPSHAGRLQGNPKVITPDVPDAKAVFIANVDLPETATRTERGLDAMRLALSNELLAGDNQGFLREQAALFAIVVSDEDDHSIGPPRYYGRWLEHLKGKGEENLVSLSAIVGQQPDGCEGAEAGSRYIEVQDMTGGLFHSICEEDYGQVVDELGIQAAGLRRKFYLSQMPQQETLNVLVTLPGDPACESKADCSGDRVCTTGRRCAQQLAPLDDGGVWIWEQEANAIFFPETYMPPAGATIDVAYYREAG